MANQPQQSRPPQRPLTQKEIRAREKRRQKIRRRRLMIVILAGVLFVLAVLGGGYALVNRFILEPKREEERLRQESISISESIQAELELEDHYNYLKSMMPYGNITSETLTPLKEMALQAYTEAENGKITHADNNQLANQAEYFLMNLDEYDDDILAFYLNNTERFEFVKSYPYRVSHQTPPEQLSQSLDTVPEVYQWSLDWGYLPYGTSTMYYAGCAPTCLSMAFSYLNQDPTITPYVIKKFSEDNGYYVDGVGTSHALLDDVGAQYGINGARVEVNKETISQCIAEGNVVLLNMVPGTFTSVGHFIVAYADQDGKLVIRDPNNIARTNTLWDYDAVLAECAYAWSYWK